jgi:CheY-like chemotaxis protein
MTKNLHQVLIIDDDEINNFVCKKVILKAGVAEDVVAVQSGSEALAYLQRVLDQQPEAPPELILLDISMPYMNGWEFLAHYRAYKAQFASPPVIAILSSSVYEADAEGARAEPEIQDYVTKPLTVENFTALVEKHFSKERP